jgi:N6-adenosine-specific RNA methylase IME4
MVLEKWESPLEDKYPTMTEEQLKTLDIENLSAEDSVCFMWTTLSTLPEALRLLEDWGFKYHITLTWDKGGGWSANGFHRRTELVLFGYRGILSKVLKQEGEYIPTVFGEPKGEHSAKPQKMYEYIEKRTNGKKIELFARNKRDGWDVWGNEV